MNLRKKLRRAIMPKKQSALEFLAMHPEKIWRKNEWQRADMTISCKDSDYIPKVKKAGSYTLVEKQKFQLMHNGVKVLAGGYHGTWMQKIIEDLKGHHEPQEEKLFHEITLLLEDSPVIIELGSFWAYYSNWLLTKFSKARALCCEPDPNNMEVGRTNGRANGVLDRMTFISAAAGSEDKKNIRLELDSQPGNYISTVIRTVDSIVEEHKLKKVDILHMDVQGAELDAIKGALDSVAKNKIRFIFVSTHHYLFSGDPMTHQKCKQLLEDNGAHIIASHSVLQSFSGDGLIVASFDKKDKKIHIPISMNDSDNSLFRPYEEDLDELISYAELVK